jgi:hypothetical protein
MSGCKYSLKGRVPWNSVKQIIHIPCTIGSRLCVSFFSLLVHASLVETYNYFRMKM